MRGKPGTSARIAPLLCARGMSLPRRSINSDRKVKSCDVTSFRDFVNRQGLERKYQNLVTNENIYIVIAIAVNKFTKKFNTHGGLHKK